MGNEDLTALVKELDNKNISLMEENSRLKDKVEQLQESLDAFSEYGSLEEIDEALALAGAAIDNISEYTCFGSPAEINESMNKLEELLSKLAEDSADETKKLDDKEVITKVGQLATEDSLLLDQYKNIGTIADILNMMNLLKEYKEFGTLDELQQVFKIAEGYASLGNIGEIRLGLLSLKEYSALGSVDQIKLDLEQLAKFKELGTLEELAEITELLEKKMNNEKESQKEPEDDSKGLDEGYLTLMKELGTPEEINDVMAVAESFIMEKIIKKLAESQNRTEEECAMVFNEAEKSSSSIEEAFSKAEAILKKEKEEELKDSKDSAEAEDTKEVEETEEAEETESEKDNKSDNKDSSPSEETAVKDSKSDAPVADKEVPVESYVDSLKKLGSKEDIEKAVKIAESVLKKSLCSKLVESTGRTIEECTKALDESFKVNQNYEKAYLNAEQLLTEGQPLQGNKYRHVLSLFK